MLEPVLYESRIAMRAVGDEHPLKWEDVRDWEAVARAVTNAEKRNFDIPARIPMFIIEKNTCQYYLPPIWDKSVLQYEAVVNNLDWDKANSLRLYNPGLGGGVVRGSDCTSIFKDQMSACGHYGETVSECGRNHFLGAASRSLAFSEWVPYYLKLLNALYEKESRRPNDREIDSNLMSAEMAWQLPESLPNKTMFDIVREVIGDAREAARGLRKEKGCPKGKGCPDPSNEEDEEWVMGFATILDSSSEALKDKCASENVAVSEATSVEDAYGASQVMVRVRSEEDRKAAGVHFANTLKRALFPSTMIVTAIVEVSHRCAIHRPVRTPPGDSTPPGDPGREPTPDPPPSGGGGVPPPRGRTPTTPGGRNTGGGGGTTTPGGGSGPVDSGGCYRTDGGACINGGCAGDCDSDCNCVPYADTGMTSVTYSGGGGLASVVESKLGTGGRVESLPSRLISGASMEGARPVTTATSIIRGGANVFGMQAEVPGVGEEIRRQ